MCPQWIELEKSSCFVVVFFNFCKLLRSCEMFLVFLYIILLLVCVNFSTLSRCLRLYKNHSLPDIPAPNRNQCWLRFRFCLCKLKWFTVGEIRAIRDTAHQHLTRVTNGKMNPLNISRRLVHLCVILY